MVFQQGIALITALVIVFVIAILGTAIGHQVFTLGKMSTNDYDQIMSFANADSAVSEGGAIIMENAYATSSAVLTLGATGAAVIAEFPNATWWTTSTNWNGAHHLTNNGTALSGDPLYIIEDVGSASSNLDMSTSVASRHFFRVTSKANGKGDATTFIQANYAIWE